MSFITKRTPCFDKPSCLQQMAMTMIELLVVMAILAGMLAAAVPNYTQFMLKSKVFRVFNAVRPYQLSMVEYFFSQDKWPSARQLGVNLPDELVRHHSLLTNATINGGLTSDAGIELVFNSPHFSQALEVMIQPVFRYHQLAWSCVPSESSLQAGLQRYLPSQCLDEHQE